MSKNYVSCRERFLRGIFNRFNVRDVPCKGDVPYKENWRQNTMLQTSIAVIAIVAVIVLWAISTQRKLVVLDENISNAMSQIGVQISSRFDALMTLLDLTKSYASQESETLIETIKIRRKLITAKSSPQDVLCQERIISEALGRLHSNRAISS